MVLISSSGGGSTTRRGSGHSSNSGGGISTGTRSGSGSSSDSDPFSGGYSGPAVVAPDGSLVSTGGVSITQVGEASSAAGSPGTITGAADDLAEVRRAVAEKGGNPDNVSPLVKNPNVDSEGAVLQRADLLDAFNEAQVENAFQSAFAQTRNSITRNRPSPLANGSDLEAQDPGVTDSVFAGEGDSSFTITGTTDGDGPNTGAQSVPGVPEPDNDNSGSSSSSSSSSSSGSGSSSITESVSEGLDIGVIAGSVVSAVVIGYILTQVA